jgi:hypothetical protein
MVKNVQRHRSTVLEYDLNSDRAPVLAVVAENDAGFDTPLAFGKEKKLNFTFRIIYLCII